MRIQARKFANPRHTNTVVDVRYRPEADVGGEWTAELMPARGNTQCRIQGEPKARGEKDAPVFQ